MRPILRTLLALALVGCGAVAKPEGWAAPVAVDIFRLAGIYGPGRSAFDDLRSGTARRTIKPGHAFGRIHSQ